MDNKGLDNGDLGAILAERITALAKSKGISINRLLAACGLSKSLVDNIRKGSTPSVDKLTPIADYFGVSVDYLLGRPNPTTESSADGLLRSSSLPYRSLMLAFNRGEFEDLTEDEVEALASIAQMLKKQRTLNDK